MPVKKVYQIPKGLSLLPCPFCGEEETGVVDMADCFGVQCECCNTIGPDGSDLESAVVQWNLRPQESRLVHLIKLAVGAIKKAKKLCNDSNIVPTKALVLLEDSLTDIKKAIKDKEQGDDPQPVLPTEFGN